MRWSFIMKLFLRTNFLIIIRILISMKQRFLKLPRLLTHIEHLTHINFTIRIDLITSRALTYTL